MTAVRPTEAPFPQRLGDRIERTGTLLCLGMDPDPEALPAGFTRDLRGVEEFGRLLLRSAAQWASAVKANLAFFEAFGAEGITVLERLRAELPAGLPFIADAKRGDIGSTSARHAVAIFDRLGADAVTASPYLGREAIAPLLEHRDGFVYVLCRTSDPGAGEFQDLHVPWGTSSGREVRMGGIEPKTEPLYMRVARRVAAWADDGDGIGLVVGATAPEEMAAVRSAAPGTPFLVPGVGRQGGNIAAVLAHAPAVAGRAGRLPGGAALVNVSRGIAESVLGDVADPGEALYQAAKAWAEQLRV